MLLIVLCTVIGTLLSNCEAGRRLCYHCSTVIHGEDCLYNPENVTIADNPKTCEHFCTIERKEFINIPGEWWIAYLERDCRERPLMLDGVNAESYHITYYRSCKGNYCNGGDGLSSLKDVPEDDIGEEEEVPESSTHSLNNEYRSNSIRIFKIYFFAFVAYIFSIT